MLGLKNNEALAIRLSDLEIDGVQREDEERQAKFDLTLEAVETPRGLHIGFEYAKDLFNEQSIKRIAGYYERFIKAIIEEPTIRLSEVALLDSQELAVLKSWNETEYRYPKDKCIHQLFEESAQSNPDRIAVTYENQQITYEILNE